MPDPRVGSEPHFENETAFLHEGFQYIAGVDEVGRGCLAGPVVAAAVILDPSRLPAGVNDSKLLSAKVRESLALQIRECAVAWAIGIGEVEEIDRINILNSSKAAMVRALEALVPGPHAVLVDGNFKIPTKLPQRCIIRGDQISISIAAASIIAKVFRDTLMAQMDVTHPGYAFAKHKGYGSVEHRLALQNLGPTPIHRRSFTWTPVPLPPSNA